MTQLSVSPVDPGTRTVPTARIVGGGRVDHRSFRDLIAVPRPVAPGWSVGDVVASVAGAAAAALAVRTVGVGLEPWLAAAVVLVWPALLAGHGFYARRPLGESFASRVSRVIRAGGALALLSWVGTLVLGDALASAVMIPTTLALIGTGLLVAALGHRGSDGARVVVAGHPENVAMVADELGRSARTEVVGACVPEGSVGHLDVPVRTGIESAVAMASRLGADAVVVAPGPDISPSQVRRLQWQASALGVGTYVSTGLQDVSSFRMSLAAGPGPNLVHVRPTASKGLRRALKDVTERALTAMALVVLLPVILATAVAVRLDSTGPVLFRQTRVGRHGRHFTMLKFRTMCVRAEDELDRLAPHNDSEGGVLFKLRTDPRITRAGAFLRRYSLDELPQLWHVITGDMSLVGPRPALPEEVARYDVDPHRRLEVKPGLTGLWQVSGRSDLNWEQSVRLDLRYVDNWSLRLDASILCRTVRAVLGHRGAY